MKRKLKSPQIVIYENVQKIEDILENYLDCGLNFENIAKDILDEFKIPYGKKEEIDLFENNISAEIINGKVKIKVK